VIPSPGTEKRKPSLPNLQADYVWYCPDPAMYGGTRSVTSCCGKQTRAARIRQFFSPQPDTAVEDRTRVPQAREEVSRWPA